MKQKPKLQLNIPQKISYRTLNNPNTPTKELASPKVRKAFQSPVSGEEFRHSQGSSLCFNNQYIFKFGPPITPGAYGVVRKGQLISPDGDSSKRLIEKRGDREVLHEIEIYRLIHSNPQSAKEALLQPFFNIKKSLGESSLYLPTMLGGSLKKQQSFIHNALWTSDTDVELTWFYRETVSLLKALRHLHTEVFNSNKHGNCRGIVHGDIKPDNVLINAEGSLILADFGCAYPLSEPATAYGATCYTAPEIFANENFRKKTINNIEKSDIWSLGATLYFLLNNKLLLEDKFSAFFQSNEIHHKKNPATFFQLTFEGVTCRKDWGKTFDQSTLAKEAKKEIKQLNDAASNQFTLNRLCSIVLSMLAPIDKRPSADQLLDIMKKFTPPKPSPADYGEFISSLLAQSPLSQRPSSVEDARKIFLRK